MTHVTDAQGFLVKARNRLGNAVLNPRSNLEARIIGEAIAAVRYALDTLDGIPPQQQTAGGANLPQPPAGDQRMNTRDKYYAMADALGGAEAMARVLGFSEVEELLGEHRSTCLRIAEHIQAGIREKAGQS